MFFSFRSIKLRFVELVFLLRQFKKLLGKRGRVEENIDIIDVNVDDQVGSSQEWKTNYQKEDADYKPQSKVMFLSSLYDTPQL